MYCSVAAWKPRATQWREMLRRATAFNQNQEIRSLLLHGEGRYVQWLEGPSAALAPLWTRIRSDPRHVQVTLLHRAPRPVHPIHLHAHRPLAAQGPMGLVEMVHAVRDLYLNAQVDRGIKAREDAARVVDTILTLKAPSGTD